jgi:hypothetical protein
MNEIIKRHFGNCMTTDTKLRLNNTTSKVALFYGSQTWTINKRDTQKTDATKMKFLITVLGLNKI